MKEKCVGAERQRFLRFGRYFAGLIQTMAHPSAAKCESNKTKAFERSDYRSSASASVSLQLSKLPIYRGEALSTCKTKLVIAPYIPLKSTYITSWKTGEGEPEWESLKFAIRVEQKQMPRKNTRSLWVLPTPQSSPFFFKQAVVAASERLICLREIFDDSFTGSRILYTPDGTKLRWQKSRIIFGNKSLRPNRTSNDSVIPTYQQNEKGTLNSLLILFRSDQHT